MGTRNFNTPKGQAKPCAIPTWVLGSLRQGTLVTIEKQLLHAILKGELLTVQGICDRAGRLGHWSVDPTDFTGYGEGDVDAFLNMDLPHEMALVGDEEIPLIRYDAFEYFMWSICTNMDAAPGHHDDELYQ